MIDRKAGQTVKTTRRGWSGWSQLVLTTTSTNHTHYMSQYMLQQVLKDAQQTSPRAPLQRVATWR